MTEHIIDSTPHWSNRREDRNQRQSGAVSSGWPRPHAFAWQTPNHAPIIETITETIIAARKYVSAYFAGAHKAWRGQAFFGLCADHWPIIDAGHSGSGLFHSRWRRARDDSEHRVIRDEFYAKRDRGRRNRSRTRGGQVAAEPTFDPAGAIIAPPPISPDPPLEVTQRVTSKCVLLLFVIITGLAVLDDLFAVDSSFVALIVIVVMS